MDAAEKLAIQSPSEFPIPVYTNLVVSLADFLFSYGYELHCGIIFLFRKFCRCRETTEV